MAWGSIDWWICVPGSTWNWSVIMVLCKDFWEDQAHRPKFITSTELQSTLAWPDADAALLLLLHFCKQCKVTPTKHLQLPTKGIIEIKPAPNYSIKTMTKLPWPTFQQGAPKRWNFCGRPHLADHTPRRRHSNPPSRRPCPGLWCVALLPRPWAPSSWDVKMFPLRKARPTSSNSPNLQLFMVLMSIWIQKTMWALPSFSGSCWFCIWVAEMFLQVFWSHSLYPNQTLWIHVPFSWRSCRNSACFFRESLSALCPNMGKWQLHKQCKKKNTSALQAKPSSKFPSRSS